MRGALVAMMLTLTIAGAYPRRAAAESADAPASPLHLLHCANDDASAAAAIDAAAATTNESFSLPVDVTSTGPVVRAAEVDAMLLLLHDLHQRFPAQRTRIEGLILSWTYCDLLYRNQAWDLGLEGGVAVRAKAPEQANGSRGFRAWGLLPGDSEHTVPTLLLENSLGPGQREWFISESVHGHCFPDPITGLTPFDDDSGESATLGSRAPQRAEIPGIVAFAPLELETKCPLPKPKVVVAPVPEVKAPRPEPKLEPKPAPHTASLVMANPSEGTTGFLAAPASDPDGSVKLAGNFYVSAPLRGGSSIGTRVSLLPIENVFVRTGLSQRLDHQSTSAIPTYSYGVGYNDWHAGTLSAELNHWGPIPIDEVDIDGAQLDFGYKVRMPELLAQNFGMGIGLTIPFSRSLSLSCGVNVKLFGDWFVMSGLRWTPADESYSWVYGFGVWSWKPYTFSMTYNNWGLNEAFDANVVQNGSVTLAWSWVL